MCVVDWSLVADLLGSLAAVVTAVIAYYAIIVSYPDWKKRQDQIRKSDRAEQVLASFYECRNTLRSVRSPIHSGAEISEAKKNLEERGVEHDGIGSPFVTAQVTLTRVNDVMPQWQKLIDLMPFATVNFHADVNKALEDTLRVRAEVVSAAQRFPDAEAELRESMRRKIFFGPNDEEDEILRRLKAI